MKVYFESAVNPAVSVGWGAAKKGKWGRGRRVNGDEIPEWMALRFRDEHGMQRMML